MIALPPTGLRLWLTRPAGRGAAATLALRAAGVQVLERPVIALLPPPDDRLEEARRLWSDPAGWDWRIFSSPAAVAVVSGWTPCPDRPSAEPAGSRPQDVIGETGVGTAADPTPIAAGATRSGPTDSGLHDVIGETIAGTAADPTPTAAGATRSGPAGSRLHDVIGETSAGTAADPTPIAAGATLGALAAVGPATARAVEAAFGTACLAGPGTGGAAGLLSLPAFVAQRVRGMRILLLQGEGGRELLEPALSARGARVGVARVYRRVALPLAVAAADWPHGLLPQALTLSSVEGVQAVARAARTAGADWVPMLGQVAWSARVAAVARAEGFIGPCVTLPSDVDPDSALLAACRQLQVALGLAVGRND